MQAAGKSKSHYADGDNDDDAILAAALEAVFFAPSESTGAGTAALGRTTATATLKALSASAPAAALLEEA